MSSRQLTAQTAGHAHLSRRSIQTLMRLLERHGYVTVTARGRYATYRYRPTRRLLELLVALRVDESIMRPGHSECEKTLSERSRFDPEPPPAISGCE